MPDNSLMAFIQKNIDLAPPLKLTGWRKIAIGTWKTVGDPSVYATLEVDAGRALKYIENLRAKTGLHITLSHFAGKALATALKHDPDINCILRFGRLYPRKTVDIFFQVASDEEGADLSGTIIRDADKKSIQEIAREMNERVKAIRERRDRSYTKMKNLAAALPGALAFMLLNIGSFIMYTLNLWTPLLGTPRDSFGSMMLTNIGSIGLDEAFAPLVPYSKIPLLIALGAVRERPIVRDGQVVAGKTLKLCATFDHRLIDGVHGGKLAKTVRAVFENPEKELA